MAAAGGGAARTFDDWLDLTSGVAKKAIPTESEVEAFCPAARDVWNEFRTSFASFLDARFGIGPPDRDFNALLDLFFLFERPDLLLRGCVLLRGQFEELARLVRDIDIPFLDRVRFDASGLTLSDLVTMTDDEFDDAFDDWPVLGISLAGRRGPAWALDWMELSTRRPHTGVFDTDFAKDLIHLLGLVDLATVRRAVLVRYNRSTHHIEPRTPTPVDGIGHPLYRIPGPCDKLGGYTLTHGGGTGVREAVHAQARIRGAAWNAANIR